MEHQSVERNPFVFHQFQQKLQAWEGLRELQRTYTYQTRLSNGFSGESKYLNTFNDLDKELINTQNLSKIK